MHFYLLCLLSYTCSVDHTTKFSVLSSWVLVVCFIFLFLSDGFLVSSSGFNFSVLRYGI